jgi:cell division protein FtsA
MARNEQYVVGLDVGTSKVCCVVAEVRDNDAIHIVGLGDSPSKGIRKGVVVNLDTTVDAIRSCVEQAELMAGVSVDSVVAGIAGGHVRSFNSRGVVSVSGKDRTVSREDCRRVLEAARAVNIPPDREILHVIPQEYVLDDQGGIHSPVGMTGSLLEANVHIITAACTSLQNLVTCINRAGIEVRETVLEQVAASESVLSAHEKELGAALIDIGGGTTDLTIFERGSIWHTSVLPVGGDHFSNDLAIGLRTPAPDAERLKRKYGCALASMVEENDSIEVPSVGGRKSRQLSRQVMAEILQPRAEEVFTLIHEEIERAGFHQSLNAGIVLTGGGCMLPGMSEVAEQVFDLPVRCARPGGVEGLVDPASGPQHATAVGLVVYAAHHRVPDRRPALAFQAGLFGKFGGRVKAWFTEMF